MGIYFNPTNESFTQAKNSMIYVDKTELLEQLNLRLSTENKCIAVSHARRFGKSHAAGMIDAYYSLGCDSSNLFDNTKIAANADYKKYMNKYNVIHLDISSFWDDFTESLLSNRSPNRRPMTSTSVRLTKDAGLRFSFSCPSCCPVFRMTLSVCWRD